MKSHIWRYVCLAVALSLPALGSSSAAEVKVLTAGAFKQVVLALAADAEKQTGNKLIIDNDTAGALQKRIESGEPFDVAIITPAIVDSLANSGKITPNSRVNLATVEIGVVVKEGATEPSEVSTRMSERLRPSRTRCLPRNRSPISIRPAAAQAGSISISCSSASASRIKSGQRQSSRKAAMSPN